VNDQFDAQLLRRARLLARVAQSQIGRPITEPVTLAIASALAHPNGPLPLPVWAAETLEARLAPRGFSQPANKVQLADDLPAEENEGSEIHYFEIYSEAGAPLQRSRSLGEESLDLPPTTRATLGLLEWRFDDTELAGVPLRLVTLKAPVFRFRFQRISGMWRGQGTGPPRLAAPDRSGERSLPPIFIQAASSTGTRNHVLAGLHEELNHDLAALELETGTTLGALQTRLLWICLASFVAVAVGACWLVGVGLSPLRRLSQAVGQVSAKDFRLAVDAEQMPQELQAIVARLTETLGLLERAFAREKQAAVDISHELRTPVAALLTTIEVALRKPRPVERYESLLRECHAICQQMSQMVERLLALAKLDAGADTIHAKSVDVGEIVEQCLSLVRPLAASRQLTIDLDCPKPVHLHTDPDKLREILTNLLHNAIEYNRPGGRVGVAVERNNGYVEFAVHDTGVGISKDAHGQIFERFYRADGSRAASVTHAGLGLSIVKGYVELLGGSLSLKSDEGMGSTFSVRLADY
jgi:signal transduction histidine kinase